MKTTDLIPLILLELADGDKYGIELTKSIEAKSNGKVVIKQPTLYTILKKLEKSKFISSFWQDSEIGGKRHYYRLTQNGKMQVSTLPDFSTLISSISNEDENEADNSAIKNEEFSDTLRPTTSQQTQNSYQNETFSIKDEGETQKVQDDETKSTQNEIHIEKTETEMVQNRFDDILYENDFVDLANDEKKLAQTESTQSEPVKYVSIMDLLLDDDNADNKDNDKKDSATNENGNENNAKIDNILDTSKILVKPDNDEILTTTPTELKESILPTEEVFSLKEIDNATEIEINQQNAHILKGESANKDEKFANSENVSKFTETSVHPLTDEYVSKLKDRALDNSIKSYLNSSSEPKSAIEEDIKFVDYADIKKDKNYIYSKKLAKNMLYRLLSSCAYLLVMLIISSIAVNHTATSPLYYVFLIVSILFILFSITIYLMNYEKFRLKHKSHPLNLDIKKMIIIASSIFVVIFILCVIVSVASGVNNVFALSNFANLYAPLLMSTTILVDVAFAHLFQKRSNI